MSKLIDELHDWGMWTANDDNPITSSRVSEILYDIANAIEEDAEEAVSDTKGERMTASQKASQITTIKLTGGYKLK